jgi:protein TonB
MNRADMRHLKFDDHLNEGTEPDLLVLPYDEIDLDNFYGRKINDLIFERKNLWGLALSLLVHSTILLTLWIFHKPAVFKDQKILTVTLVGNGEQTEGSSQDGGGSVTDGQASEEPAQVAPVSDPERSIANPEIAERHIPPTKTTPVPDRKPQKDKPKKRSQNTNQSTLSDSTAIEDGKTKHANGIDREGEVGQGTATRADAGGNGLGDGPAAGSAGVGSTGGNGGNGLLGMRFGSPDGPRFLKKVLPVYPEIARRIEKEGQVVLQLIIDDQSMIMAAS